jgi:hypothetical protein
MAGRNGASADVVEAQVVHDFDALLNEARASDKPAAVFHMADGTTFTIPQPVEWSDEVLRLQAEVQANNTAAMVSLAEELLGDQYPAFVERGGSAMKLSRILDKLLGASVGESSAS